MMRIPILWSILIVCLSGVFVPSGQAGDLSKAEGVFSHKRHAPLRMDCVKCHANARTDEEATFPALSACKTCHVNAVERTLPSKRVYRVRDFVFFGHGAHAKAGVPCATCHGEVNAQNELVVARPTTMQACVDCHKEHKAPVSCNACHELGH